MKVAAALSWFDESPQLLAQCIESLEGFIDVLVAVDGPYALWEHENLLSSPAEYEQIQASAAAAHLELIFLPPLSQPRQVEKRSAAIQAASARADWVMPLDSDWSLSGDSKCFRTELETTTGDAGLVKFFTPGIADSTLHEWHQVTAGKTVLYPFVYRSLPGLRAERAHWLYTAEKNGQRISLWPSDFYPKAELFESPVTITHHCFERDQRKIEENQRYITLRDTQWSNGHEP